MSFGKRSNIDKRNRRLLADYHRLYEINCLRQGIIISQLAEDYFLSQRTVEDIVYGYYSHYKTHVLASAA